MSLVDYIPAGAQRILSFVSLLLLISVCIAIVLLPEASAIPESPIAEVNPADTAWMLASSALVMLMTPGVALFYGGLVRHKNVLSTMMSTIVNMGAISVLWIFVGFSLSFGDSWTKAGLIGSPFQYHSFHHVSFYPDPRFNSSVPFIMFGTFQMMFAVITPSIINGCFVERANFSACLLFFSFWHLIVYCPLAHMVWHPGGLLRTWGVMDFAGGLVVHIAAGFSALAGSFVMGPREERVNAPAKLTDVLLGTAILWFGWFGFNAGSAGGANLQAVLAFLNTNTSAAVAMMAWLLIDRSKGQAFKATGACCGAVAGLVCITPCAAYVSVGGACCIGVIGAVVCNAAVAVVRRYQFIDEPMDVFALHGIGGVVGMICAALFSSSAINPTIPDGLFYGNPTPFWRTLVALAAIVPYILLASWLCCVAANSIVSLRVDVSAETTGLDVANHTEAGVAREGRFRNPRAMMSFMAVSALMRKYQEDVQMAELPELEAPSIIGTDMTQTTDLGEKTI